MSTRQPLVYPCFRAEELWTFPSLVTCARGRNALRTSDSDVSSSLEEGQSQPSRCSYTRKGSRCTSSSSSRGDNKRTGTQSGTTGPLKTKSSDPRGQDDQDAGDFDACIDHHADQDDIDERHLEKSRGTEQTKTNGNPTPKGPSKEATEGRQESPYDVLVSSSDDEESNAGIPQIRLKSGASGEPYTTVVLLPLCMRCPRPFFFSPECAATLVFRMASELLRRDEVGVTRRPGREEAAKLSPGEGEEEDDVPRSEEDGSESEGDARESSVRGSSRLCGQVLKPDRKEQEAVLICSKTQLIDHPPYEPAVSTRKNAADRRPRQSLGRRPQQRTCLPVSSSASPSRGPLLVSRLPASERSPLCSASSLPSSGDPHSPLRAGREKKDSSAFASLRKARRPLPGCLSPRSPSSPRGKTPSRRALLAVDSPRRQPTEDDASSRAEAKPTSMTCTSGPRTYDLQAPRRKKRPTGKAGRGTGSSLPREHLRSAELKRLERLKIKYVPCLEAPAGCPSTFPSSCSTSPASAIPSSAGLSALLSLTCGIPLLVSSSPPSPPPCGFFFLSPSCALAPPPPSFPSTLDGASCCEVESFFNSPLPPIRCCSSSPSPSSSFLSSSCPAPLPHPPFSASFSFYARLHSVSPSTWALFLSLLVTATTCNYTPPPVLPSSSLCATANPSPSTWSSSSSAVSSPEANTSAKSSSEDCTRNARTPALSPLVFIFELFPTACCCACCPLSAFSPPCHEKSGPRTEEGLPREDRRCAKEKIRVIGGQHELDDLSGLECAAKFPREPSRSSRQAPTGRGQQEDAGGEQDRTEEGARHRRAGEGRGKHPSEVGRTDLSGSAALAGFLAVPEQVELTCCSEGTWRQADRTEDEGKNFQHVVPPLPVAAPGREDLPQPPCLSAGRNREENSTIDVLYEDNRRDTRRLPSFESKHSPRAAGEEGELDEDQDDAREWRISSRKKTETLNCNDVAQDESEALGHGDASSSCSCGEVRLCGIESSKLIRLCRERCCRVIMLLPSLSSPSGSLSAPSVPQRGSIVGAEPGQEKKCSADSCYSACSSGAPLWVAREAVEKTEGLRRSGEEQKRGDVTEEKGQREEDLAVFFNEDQEKRGPWVEWLQGRRGGYAADLTYPGLSVRSLV